jgi:hypothetical protein
VFRGGSRIFCVVVANGSGKLSQTAGGDLMSEYNDWNAKVIAEFRANAGKVGGQFANATMVLITTTGARTGKQRTNPLVIAVVDDATD